MKHKNITLYKFTMFRSLVKRLITCMWYFTNKKEYYRHIARGLKGFDQNSLL